MDLVDRCKYCNRRIEWIIYHDPIQAKDVRLPVDSAAPTYIFDERSEKYRRSSAKVAHVPMCHANPPLKSTAAPVRQWWNKDEED